MKNTETKNIETLVAYELGRTAFENGKSSAPCLDKTFMKMIEGNEVGESLQVLKAWTKGWHTANAQAIVA